MNKLYWLTWLLGMFDGMFGIWTNNNFLWVIGCTLMFGNFIGYIAGINENED